MKKILGWLLVVAGVVWVVTILRQAPPAGADGLGGSQLLGALMVPVLVGLVDLFLAGIIKRAK